MQTPRFDMGVWARLLVTVGLLEFINAIPIDNGVKGYPKVTCGLHSIRVDVDTERPFQGRVFVKGESYNKDCIKSFAGSPPASGPVPVPAPAPGPEGYQPAPASVVPGGYGETVGIELGFGQCNMRRQRTLYPRGVEYTFTLVVSFHPLFITKVDKAYRVRCFYMETEKTVAQQLEVSMLTTHQINEQFPMPQCRYHIKRGGPEGPYIRYARVGEPVHHVWECDAPAAWLYGILVKNCYVDDGQGSRVELIDERGCANDRHILPDLSYDQSLISAWVESHVFKYADKPHLYFTCTIVLCFKQDGGCNGITPPQCLGSPVAPAPAPALPLPGPYPAPPLKPIVPVVPVVPVAPVVPVPAPVIPLPPPVAYPPPPPIAPIPAPAYGPRPAGPAFVPYNRDSPLLKDDLNATVTGNSNAQNTPSTVDKDNRDDEPDLSSSPSTFTSTSSKRLVELGTAKGTVRRHKRHLNHSDVVISKATPKKLTRDLIETDLSAQPVIVLPFEDDIAFKDDGHEDELQDIMRKASNGAFKRTYAIIPNGRGGGLPSGVCVSSSGFGILIALFFALFLLSTTLTVLLMRRQAIFNNSKL